MRLICSHCQLSVTVPDTAAGTPTPCPSCGQSITPPALTGAAIDAAPEPVAPAPSHVPPAPVTAPAQTPGADATRLASSILPVGAPWLHLTLRREVAHWLAPGALVVAFILTFFTWVAVAPNGTRVYTQNAWSAAGGKMSTNIVGDRVMQAETELNSHLHMSIWLLSYLILLIPTLIVAIADRALARNPTAVPDVFRTIWPHRQTIVAGLCALLTLLLLLSLTTGFGLQSAAIAAAAPAATDKPEPTSAEVAERGLQHDLKIARYGLERTIWLELAVAAQLVALAGIGMSWWLDRHPKAPDPRIEIYC
jgi:hypothetical protein